MSSHTHCCFTFIWTQAFSDNLDRIKAHNDMYARGEYSFELGVNRKWLLVVHNKVRAIVEKTLTVLPLLV